MATAEDVAEAFTLSEWCTATGLLDLAQLADELTVSYVTELKAYEDARRAGDTAAAAVARDEVCSLVALLAVVKDELDWRRSWCLQTGREWPVR